MQRVITEKRWQLKTAADESSVDSLMHEFAERKKFHHRAIFELLVQRGITTYEAAKDYFNPQLTELHDPFLMQDMTLAADRVVKAIEDGEKVLVFGDYDVDGTTSASMMYLFLQSLNVDCTYYIPHRYDEGYGISEKSIRFAVEEGYSLFIALDCGIKAFEQIALARENDLDVIVCDHHTPEAELPNAFAVLDPKRKDCLYPFKELSGCGVGFKLIQAVLEKTNGNTNDAMKYLDLLCTSIGADIVEMTGENRILAKYGLDKINRDPLPGIAAIKAGSKYEKDYSISDVVFKIAPRINSAGRMASGNMAVQLLTSMDKSEAAGIVEMINQHNSDRGEKDRSITEEALAQLSEDPENEEKKTTVVFDPGWHKGVIGIVASRLMDTYYRPSIVFTGDGEIISGSARSVKGFDVYQALDACSGDLIQFGGHKYAAGMTMYRDALDSFKKNFEAHVAKQIDPEMLTPSIEVDLELKLGEINSKFYQVLKYFSPFGPGNMNPIFQSNDVLISEVRTVGQDGSHLKLRVFDPDHPNFHFDAIGFGFGALAEEMVEGQPFDLLYHIEENEWNGKKKLQLHIKDIKI